MTKVRSSGNRAERLDAVALAQSPDRSLPLEIREEKLRNRREAFLNELRQQYLNGTYYVPAEEISHAVVEKHLKR